MGKAAEKPEQVLVAPAFCCRRDSARTGLLWALPPVWKRQ